MKIETKFVVSMLVILVILASGLYFITKFWGSGSGRGENVGNLPGDVSIVEVKIGETVSVLDVSVTPLEVIEDSRCPLDVQCIQAGTVRLRATLESGLGTGEQVFKLGEAITTEAENVTLTGVSPVPDSRITIKPNDYRFTFTVRKRAEIKISDRFTTFAKAGTVTFNNPGQKKDTLYLVYEEPGRPALSKELYFDANSTCAASNGAALCLAISAPLSVSYGGKRVSVEGFLDGDRVLVRLVRVLEEGNLARPQRELKTGEIIIPWPFAVMLMENCEVSLVGQTHSLDINLTLKDGREVRSVEPMIDELFNVVSRTRNTCGDIPVATE